MAGNSDLPHTDPRQGWALAAASSDDSSRCSKEGAVGDINATPPKGGHGVCSERGPDVCSRREERWVLMHPRAISWVERGGRNVKQWLVSSSSRFSRDGSSRGGWRRPHTSLRDNSVTWRRTLQLCNLGEERSAAAQRHSVIVARAESSREVVAAEARSHLLIVEQRDTSAAERDQGPGGRRRRRDELLLAPCRRVTSRTGVPADPAVRGRAPEGRLCGRGLSKRAEDRVAPEEGGCRCCWGRVWLLRGVEQRLVPQSNRPYRGKEGQRTIRISSALKPEC